LLAGSELSFGFQAVNADVREVQLLNGSPLLKAAKALGNGLGTASQGVNPAQPPHLSIFKGEISFQKDAYTRAYCQQSFSSI
jgi:hypothetical protein